MFSYMTVT